MVRAAKPALESPTKGDGREALAGLPPTKDRVKYPFKLLIGGSLGGKWGLVGSGSGLGRLSTVSAVMGGSFPLLSTSLSIESVSA